MALLLEVPDTMPCTPKALPPWLTMPCTPMKPWPSTPTPVAAVLVPATATPVFELE